MMLKKVWLQFTLILQTRTPMRLSHFLILSLIFVGGCASAPIDNKFDGDWEFIQSPTDQKQKACLDEDDVKKLKELLIRLKAEME